MKQTLVILAVIIMASSCKKEVLITPNSSHQRDIKSTNIVNSISYHDLLTEFKKSRKWVIIHFIESGKHSLDSGVLIKGNDTLLTVYKKGNFIELGKSAQLIKAIPTNFQFKIYQQRVGGPWLGFRDMLKEINQFCDKNIVHGSISSTSAFNYYLGGKSHEVKEDLFFDFVLSPKIGLSKEIERKLAEYQAEHDDVFKKLEGGISSSKFRYDEWIDINTEIEELASKVVNSTNSDEIDDLNDSLRFLNEHKKEIEFELYGIYDRELRTKWVSILNNIEKLQTFRADISTVDIPFYHLPWLEQSEVLF